MKRKWISMAMVLATLIVLSIVGIGSLGAQSAPEAQAVENEVWLEVDPPQPWHDPLCAGDRERYTLTFTNKTGAALTDVVVTDTLPDVCPDGCEVCLWNNNGWPYDDCSPGANYDGQRTVSWEGLTVGAGETVTLYLEVRFRAYIPQGTVLENCLSVDSNETGPEAACSDVTLIECATPTPTPSNTPTTAPSSTPTKTPTGVASGTPTNTPTTGPSGTPTNTPTPDDTLEPSATPTLPLPLIFKLYIPDIYARHVIELPTATLTPTPLPTPIELCYRSTPGVGLMYRVDPSLFRGYTEGSATDHPLILVTEPPAPAGWNLPGFVPDSAWRAPVGVNWPVWSFGDWRLTFPATIIGMNRSDGRQEGLDGTTHLIRQSFELTPPEPGMHITAATMDMWSDNRTAWWWNGVMVEAGRQLQDGDHQLFPDHLSGTGGTYLLAIQNSNDYMKVENPQGTAYQICVTWER